MSNRILTDWEYDEMFRKLDRLTTRERRKQATDGLYSVLGDGSEKPRTTKDMMNDLSTALATADTSAARDALDEISAVCDQIDAKRQDSANMLGGGSGGNASLGGDTPLSSKGMRTENLFPGLHIKVRK